MKRWRGGRYVGEEDKWGLSLHPCYAVDAVNLLSDIVDDDDAMRSSVVAGGDGSEPLLSSCVPLRKTNPQQVLVRSNLYQQHANRTQYIVILFAILIPSSELGLCNFNLMAAHGYIFLASRTCNFTSQNHKLPTLLQSRQPWKEFWSVQKMLS